MKQLRSLTAILVCVGLMLAVATSTTSQIADAFNAPPVSSVDTRAALAVAQLHGWYNTNAYTTTGWWQSANALGATIDYMQATGSRAYLTDVQNFYNAHADTNFIVNAYYDDEGWWALTWIKAYNLTGNTAYLNTAKAIFANMTGGWDATCGGGLWWTTAKTYKNAIPNEIFLDLAAQLHQLTPGDTAYETWATQEWSWFSNTGLINGNLVYDGLTSSCQPNLTTKTYTYNQGVILSGLVAQYQITSDNALLNQAQAIAGAVIASPTLSPQGILTEQCEAAGTCSSDSAMFKGIFIQNLVILDRQAPSTAYESYMAKNANSVWTRDITNNDKFGLHWAGSFDSADAARQASALDLFNSQLQPGVNLTTAKSTVYSAMFGNCLDDHGNGSAAGNVIDLYACNGSAAQNWQVTSGGKIQINGKCLDVSGSGTANGSKAVLNACSSNTSQTWHVSDLGTITNANSGKCLDDPSFSTTSGTQLDIWTCNGGNNQIWYFQ